jgi:hypothetical protein
LELLIEIYPVNLFVGKMEQYKVTDYRNWKVYNEILFLNKKICLNVLFVPTPICFREKFFPDNKVFKCQISLYLLE